MAAASAVAPCRKRRRAGRTSMLSSSVFTHRLRELRSIECGQLRGIGMPGGQRLEGALVDALQAAVGMALETVDPDPGIGVALGAKMFRILVTDDLVPGRVRLYLLPRSPLITVSSRWCSRKFMCSRRMISTGSTQFSAIAGLPGDGIATSPKPLDSAAAARPPQQSRNAKQRLRIDAA